MREIKHIVFDVGRVLLHWDVEIPFSRLIPDKAERAWFFENVCTPQWNVEQDRGRSWAAAEALLIDQHPGYEELIRAFRGQWHEMVPHAIDGSVKIMRELLNADHDITLLTNFAADTFGEVRERFTFLNETRGVTVSAEIGLIKPDAAIYHHHAEKFGLSAPQTLFIDDSVANVSGAQAAGWQATLFETPENLRGKLVKAGLMQN